MLNAEEMKEIQDAIARHEKTFDEAEDFESEFHTMFENIYQFMKKRYAYDTPAERIKDFERDLEHEYEHELELEKELM